MNKITDFGTDGLNIVGNVRDNVSAKQNEGSIFYLFFYIFMWIRYILYPSMEKKKSNWKFLMHRRKFVCLHNLLAGPPGLSLVHSKEKTTSWNFKMVRIRSEVLGAAKSWSNHKLLKSLTKTETIHSVFSSFSPPLVRKGTTTTQASFFTGW